MPTHSTQSVKASQRVFTMHEYDDWARWAQIPAGNIVERNDGLSNYVRGLAWNTYISEFGTADERNDWRAQETAALSYIHMEGFAQMDDLRRETMIMTAAFASLKRPGGGGGGGGAAGSMRAEKPEKMVPEMQTLELVDEHRCAQIRALSAAYVRKFYWKSPQKKTPAAEISVLASVGVYMREIADLASSRWLKPDPEWYFFSGSLPWLGNGWPKS